MLPVTNLKVDKSCCEKSICSETSLIAQLECDATDGREVLHMGQNDTSILPQKRKPEAKYSHRIPTKCVLDRILDSDLPSMEYLRLLVIDFRVSDVQKTPCRNSAIDGNLTWTKML